MKKVKFKSWAITWVEDKRNYVKESTYANYVIVLKNHLIPKIGAYYVEDITKEVIQEIILSLCTHGRVDGRGGLSEKTVKDAVTVLKMCLRDYGIKEEQLFCRNAFRYPVSNKFTEMKILDEKQYQKMLRAIQGEESYEAIGYAVSLFTGMRIGEVCALQWKDIDLNKKIIRVTKTLQRIYLKAEDKGETKLIIGTPKSKSAIREIPISSSLESFLPHKICNQEYYLLSGNSKFIEPRLYRKHFSKFLERNNLEYMRFHDIRHTFATRCIEKGGDCKTVSCLLGHSSVNITMNRYVHPQMEQKRKCVELI